MKPTEYIDKVLNEAEKKDSHYFIAIQFDVSNNKVVLIDCGTEKKCSALESKLNAHTDITMFAYDIYGGMNPKEAKAHIKKNGKTVIEMSYTTDTKKIHDKLKG